MATGRMRARTSTGRALTAALTATLVAALVGIGPAPQAHASAPQAHPAVPGVVPGAVPVPGCVAGDPARLDGRLVSGGTERRYAIHRPAPDVASRALPILLAFHGKGGSPEGIRTTTGFDDADAVVVYPGARLAAGVSAWEGTLDFPLDGVDTRFVTDLVAEVARHACVDPSRVFATGASQGGGFADVLACTAPGLLAGIAPVAGAFYRATHGGLRDCPSEPLPVLAIHGDADPVIAYHGTERSRPIPEWLAGWTGRNGCAGGPSRRTLPPDVEELRWTRCAEATEVRHLLVRGGNHGWPAGPKPAILGPGTRTATISATREILEFFGVGRTDEPAS